jgi:Golgi phosphoprotein 3 (GPP34)
MTSVALADELLLLAYDDETGRSTVPHIALDLGMAAAVLVDLVLHGRVEVTNRTVRTINPSPTGHDTADKILARIAGEEPMSVASWLQRLRHRLRESLLASLVSRGIVRDQDETAWDFIHLHRYPMVDPTAERDTRARLAEALTGNSVPDERTAALATLVAAVRMEPTLGLSGDDVAEAHKRLEEIAGGAGFAAGTILEESTVRPSVAFVIGELQRAVTTACGPAKG